MALKLVKGAKPKYTPAEVAKMATEYSELSAQIKILDGSKKNLADKLKEASEILGVKDSKGSFYYEAGDFNVGKVAKKSVSLKQEETIELLKEKGLYKKCVTIKTVEEINEKALSNAVSNGDITQEEFESLCDICKILKIDVRNSIAFGDSENDIPMLKAAGVGIAMKNAEIDVKKASDMSTLSNNEDGIPYALSELNVI